ncbi:NAD-dependent epimerase/dehydratase family protein [Xanthobacter autotrophicus]|uniref:NAD-dependent epimerase/dehydratase family protein n=1 Tax=Xanthobacter autotrophicus TaxID=280 RepID=UPI0024A6797A|nr:NAD-dependent epimerase/dehydratase family protein [Xanthobacter autotrophicus]MDI4658719.1 NAD-dependent epimerase/dehydratase family protein [Xanthobacter autotrophicus]
MRVRMTGGAGFFGSAVVHHLMGDGCHVLAFDTLAGAAVQMDCAREQRRIGVARILRATTNDSSRLELAS